MLDYTLNALPIIIPLVIYFVHLERTLAKLKTDVCWIKRSIQPPKT